MYSLSLWKLSLNDTSGKRKEAEEERKMEKEGVTNKWDPQTFSRESLV
jgi:hypothetical protein